MSALNRLTLILGVLGASLVLTACPKKSPGTDAGTDAGSQCIQDTDCPDPHLFFCNTTTGVCEPSCRVQSDCSAATRGQYALPFCAGTLGCQCDQGTCVAALCSADSDCGGTSACRNGNCVTAPAASTVATCQITPDRIVTTKGSTAKFWVSAWDSSNAPVVVQTGISWTGSDSSMTVNGSATGASALFNAVSASTTTGVSVTVGGATCTAKATIYDPTTVAVGKIEVVVTDELSGRPVPGATVVTNDAVAGTQLDSQVTAADGTATLTAAVAVNVTAFHTDFNYLTVAGYDPTATGATRFLSMVVRRNPLDKVGGYKGTFGDLPNSPNILAGIASNSLAGAITDLNVTQLLGATQDTQVTIGTAINQKVGLPVGTFLEFNQTAIKTSDSATGLAGVCTDTFAGGAGQAEALITSGTCGTRTAWGLAGDVAIADLPISAFSGGLSNIDFGAVLSQIIPIFKKFHSSVGRDVQFKLGAPPADGGYDPSGFSPFDHDFQQIPLGYQYVISVPTLPKVNGNFVDGVIALAGTNVPGRGVVPLGIGVGVNTTPVDGQVDAQSIGSTTLPAGEMFMRQAPTHHGLEGDEYGIVLLSVSLKTLTQGLATSALFQRVPGNKLTFDPAGAHPVPISGTFGAFPETAKFNFSSTAQPALPARTFKFATVPSVTGIDAIRVLFSNRAGHRWTVVASPANPTFTLPTPPNTFEDRLQYDNIAGSERGTMLVQMLGLNDNPAAGGNEISFKQLVELGSTNADRMTDFTTNFSVEDYGHPGIAWTTPNANGATLTHGSNVTVTVSKFTVPTDGIVNLAFTGGNASCTAVQGTTDASNGKGQIQLTLPAGCTGTGMTLTAALYDTQAPAQPLNPPVSAALTGITIN